MELTLDEGRYDRQELITWWDQSLLRDAKVLIVGAGALGNEVLKNLLLVGVGSIEVIDLDTIERSNLARCVFFRESDSGRFKAEAIADAARDFNPDCRIVAHVGNVTHRGVSWFGSFDLVIGALDNREARLWINQCCRKLGVTWIDGAIEGIRGVVKVFPPAGACYECTLGEQDRVILAKRRSCSLLSQDEMLTGKVPTTASMSSVIAGLQTQEAIRLLHGQESPIANSGWTFIGETFDSYIVAYGEDTDCFSHDHFELAETEMSRSSTVLDAVIQAGFAIDDSGIAIDFEREVLRSCRCEGCDWSHEFNKVLESIDPNAVRCPTCSGQPALVIASSIDTSDPLASMSYRDLGIPPLDVVTIRSSSRRTHFALGAEE